MWRQLSLLAASSPNHLPTFFESLIDISLCQRGNAAGYVVCLARRQNRLTGLFHFRRILRHAKILVQITSGAKEDCTNASHSSNLVDVLQPFRRFDHRDCEQVPVRIEWPNVSMFFVFCSGDAPRKDCIARSIAAQSRRFLVLRYSLLRIAHVLNETCHLFLVIHAIEYDPHQTHIQSLLDDPVVALKVSPVGRKSRKKRHDWLRVSLLEDRSL